MTRFFAGTTLIAVLALPPALSVTQLARERWHYVPERFDSLLFFERSVNLGSGVSPFVPVLILALVGGLWAWCQLHRVTFAEHFWGPPLALTRKTTVASRRGKSGPRYFRVSQKGHSQVCKRYGRTSPDRTKTQLLSRRTQVPARARRQSPGRPSRENRCRPARFPVPGGGSSTRLFDRARRSCSNGSVMRSVTSNGSYGAGPRGSWYCGRPWYLSRRWRQSYFADSGSERSPVLIIADSGRPWSW